MTGSIAVLGAGSWGTALAIQLARANNDTRLWGRDRENLRRLAAERRNAVYLPDAPFPDGLAVMPDLARAVAGARDVLIVVPSHGFRAMLEMLEPLIGKEIRLCWASKGFEHPSGKLLHQVAAEVLGEGRLTAVLSGPTFAREVGAGLPTAITVAAEDQAFARDLAELLSDGRFRAYTSSDVVGVEVGGAVKNVLAIGAGISDGLGFGSNTRVALINRGLAEMTRLGKALGARPETFMGLAGMGDLVLTCTDDQSRNRRMGLALAANKSIEQAQHEIRQVVEGVEAARAVHRVAHNLGVEMPICEHVYRVIYEQLSPKEAVDALMRRELKPETP